MTGLPPTSKMQAWGTAKRGERIWLMHLPADLLIPPLTSGASPAPANELHDDTIRARLGLPDTVLIVRHPEWPA